jgi:hypothetical protein
MRLMRASALFAWMSFAHKALGSGNDDEALDNIENYLQHEVESTSDTFFDLGKHALNPAAANDELKADLAWAAAMVERSNHEVFGLEYGMEGPHGITRRGRSTTTNPPASTTSTTPQCATLNVGSAPFSISLRALVNINPHPPIPNATFFNLDDGMLHDNLGRMAYLDYSGEITFGDDVADSAKGATGWHICDNGQLSCDSVDTWCQCSSDNDDDQGTTVFGESEHCNDKQCARITLSAMFIPGSMSGTIYQTANVDTTISTTTTGPAPSFTYSPSTSGASATLYKAASSGIAKANAKDKVDNGIEAVEVVTLTTIVYSTTVVNVAASKQTDRSLDGPTADCGSQDGPCKREETAVQQRAERTVSTLTITETETTTVAKVGHSSIASHRNS